MITQLPNWNLTNKYPSLYDTESVTVIEMVAKLYGKMQELISDYNKNFEEFTSTFEEFKKVINDNFNVFAVELRQEFQDFIDVIELKVKGNDEKINDAIDYMKLNIDQTTIDIINNKIQNGEINVGLQYSEETKGLYLLLEGSAMNVERS